MFVAFLFVLPGRLLFSSLAPPHGAAISLLLYKLRKKMDSAQDCAFDSSRPGHTDDVMQHVT